MTTIKIILITIQFKCSQTIYDWENQSKSVNFQWISYTYTWTWHGQHPICTFCFSKLRLRWRLNANLFALIYKYTLRDPYSPHTSMLQAFSCMEVIDGKFKTFGSHNQSYREPNHVEPGFTRQILIYYQPHQSYMYIYTKPTWSHGSRRWKMPQRSCILYSLCLFVDRSIVCVTFEMCFDKMHVNAIGLWCCSVLCDNLQHSETKIYDTTTANYFTC